MFRRGGLVRRAPECAPPAVTCQYAGLCRSHCVRSASSDRAARAALATCPHFAEQEARLSPRLVAQVTSGAASERLRIGGELFSLPARCALAWDGRTLLRQGDRSDPGRLPARGSGHADASDASLLTAVLPTRRSDRARTSRRTGWRTVGTEVRGLSCSGQRDVQAVSSVRLLACR